MTDRGRKLSVIVPIYKVEDTLDRCIESIVAQKCSGMEIILVDDGSPDGSGVICDEYAQKDSRIKPIHQQNGGYGKAVNAGLNAATGEYIPQNLRSFVGSCFLESFVVIRLPTTVPTAVGSVRSRFFDEPTVIAAR